jgi:hypothetical protein
MIRFAFTSMSSIFMFSVFYGHGHGETSRKNSKCKMGVKLKMVASPAPLMRPLPTRRNSHTPSPRFVFFDVSFEMTTSSTRAVVTDVVLQPPQASLPLPQPC